MRWTVAPEAGVDEPVSVGEAVAAWRRQLADPGVDAWRRLASLAGLRALDVDASRWWFQRDWTDTGRPLHETLRLSYSRLSNLENCELQHVLGDELGLGRVAGYQAWVGKLVHGIIERIEKGELGKTKDEILAEVDKRWRDEEFPSKAVSVAAPPDRRDAHVQELVVPVRRGGLAGQRGVLLLRVRRRDDRRRDRPDRRRSATAPASPTSRPAAPTTRRRPRRACSSASTTWPCRNARSSSRTGRCARWSSPTSRATGGAASSC